MLLRSVGQKDTRKHISLRKLVIMRKVILHQESKQNSWKIKPLKISAQDGLTVQPEQ